MERICTVILALLLAAPAFGQFELGSRSFYVPSGGGGSPTISQSALSTTDAVYSAALPNHSSGGVSCVLAILSLGGQSGTPTLTNTAGFWSGAVPDSSYTADAGGLSYGIYAWCHAKSADASSDTATVNSTAYHGGILFVDISNATAIDNSQGNGSASFSAASTGSFSLTGSSDIVFALGKLNGTAVPAGYTSLTASGTGFWGQDTYQQISYGSVTGSSVNITWPSANSPWDAFGVAIK